jgi:DNA-binding LacI/PurR family transcriptional regulator
VIVIEPVVGEAALGSPRDPFIDLDRPADGRDDAIVRSDDREGAQRVLDHLATAGADRVAMLAPPPLNAFTRDCAETYRRWCARILAPARGRRHDRSRARARGYHAALDRLSIDVRLPTRLFVPIELASVRCSRARRPASRARRRMLATTHDIGRGMTPCRRDDPRMELREARRRAARCST